MVAKNKNSAKIIGYLCTPVMSQLQIVILSYLLIINLIAFILYGVDKKRAIRNEFRIRERVLLWMARLGGGIGSWIGLKLFHHKTKHTKFRVVVPLWMIIWTAFIVLVIIKQPELCNIYDVQG